MEKLRKVLTQTTWANASDAINKNSDRIYEAITRVENATTKNKGYFETSNALLDTYPNPSVGDIAFVFNSANTIDTPYDVYKTAFSSTTNTYEWYDSGINAPFADVDINSVNDSIRDIEQQVDTLKDPRLPIICDANGRLGLNVGNGLYVDSNGDLCATQSIGGGGGSGSGGETYYAAAGISINEDNFISVKKDASLEFDNDNALRVGTGEGLVHNSQGKLSVNVGKGLVIDDKTNAIEIEEYNAIKEIPIAIQKKQDKLIEGSGIEITSENVINVDGSNLQVQLSTNAINDEDGNRIRATYVKKEEIDGLYGAIEATNTTVASHTTSIENLTNNKQDKLEFGNGLSTVGNLVKVEDAVLKDIADNKTNIGTLSSSISGKQDKFTPSDGINLDEGKLSVHIGTGLEFDPLSSAVVVKVGAGVTTDINQALAIKHDTTLTTDAEGQLGVNQGTITNIAASEVAKVVANAPANYDTLKEIADYIATDAEGAAQLSNRIGALEAELPNKMDAVAFGSGLAFSSNVVKVADTVMADIADNKSNIDKLQTSKQDTISDLATIRNNAANGATAYGWGDHRVGGYAKKVKVGNTTYEADASSVVSLPAYPTTLPASGGNADTLDNHDSSYFATASSLDSKQDKLTFGDGLSETNGTLKVDASELASVNLDVTNEGRLTVGTNTIKNIAGNGLKANNQQLDLDTSALAKVATSGSYNDLTNKPSIPENTWRPITDSVSTTNSNTSASATAVKTAHDKAVEAYNLASGKQDTIVFGSGLSVNNGIVTVDYNTASVQWSNVSGKPSFATVATSGSYNDLSNKPTIPSAVTESTISGWGFTKNTGTYSKPSGGIPKSDLASSVQTTLGNADTAYGWGYHGTAGYAKKAKVNGSTYESDSNGVINLPAYPTSLPANGGNADTSTRLINSHSNITTALGVGQVAYGSMPAPNAGNLPTASNANGVITINTFEGNYHHQLGFTPKGFYYRNMYRIPLDTTTPWNEMLHSGNLATFLSDGFESKNDGTIAISTSYVASAIKGNGLVVNDSGLSVESAPKLSTPRTIWGKSFDGSGSVNGIMREVSTIHFGNQPYGARGIYLGNWYVENLTEEDIALNFARTHFAGNVGIGTTDPQYPLDVYGNVGFGTTFGCDVFLKRTTGFSYINAAKDLAFTTGNDSANIAMSIDDGRNTVFYGNVAIGHSTPACKLDVKGDVASRTSRNTAKLISDKDCGIYLKSQGDWLHIAGSGREMYIYNGEWDNSGNGNYAQGITISTENKIGIGNKSPNYKLDVGGSFNATSGYINGNSILHTGNIGDGFDNQGSTIKISTSYIADSIKGDGLVINERGLSVNAGNGLQVNNNVVQLKLATGLAIDEYGCLYVTGL